jgi:hypothetical protein
MLTIPPPPGKLIEPQKAGKSILFSDEINIYTCYDVASSIYRENY